MVAAVCVTTNSRVAFHLNFSRDLVRGLSTWRVFVNLHERLHVALMYPGQNVVGLMGKFD